MENVADKVTIYFIKTNIGRLPGKHYTSRDVFVSSMKGCLYAVIFIVVGMTGTLTGPLIVPFSSLIVYFRPSRA